MERSQYFGQVWNKYLRTVARLDVIIIFRWLRSCSEIPSPTALVLTSCCIHLCNCDESSAAFFGKELYMLASSFGSAGR